MHLDALTAVLFSLRELTEGRLIIVFGCGGGRDKFKRPIMGEIAENFADIIIITDDNPRNENPARIRNDMTKNLSRTDKKKVIEIVDRKEAIQHSISLLKKQDFLLIAGKGHENYQIIGSKKYFFSDKQIVKKIISKLK